MGVSMACDEHAYGVSGKTFSALSSGPNEGEASEPLWEVLLTMQDTNPVDIAKFRLRNPGNRLFKFTDESFLKICEWKGVLCSFSLGDPCLEDLEVLVLGGLGHVDACRPVSVV